MKQNAIQPANLEFNAEGTPVSRDFDDVYFSNDNGLEETRYVFLDGNQLSARFPVHPRSLFVVAESGFGTGLNFLTLWQAFDQFHAAHPEATLQRLHFISFEKFPLTAHDLSNQPRTLVLSAEYCPLRDEDEAYARRLQLVNDNVSCYRIHDGIHGYLLNTSAVGLVATTYRIIEHFLDGTPLEPAPGTGTTANAPEGGDAWQDVLGTD